MSDDTLYKRMRDCIDDVAEEMAAKDQEIAKLKHDACELQLKVDTGINTIQALHERLSWRNFDFQLAYEVPVLVYTPGEAVVVGVRDVDGYRRNSDGLRLPNVTLWREYDLPLLTQVDGG